MQPANYVRAKKEEVDNTPAAENEVHLRGIRWGSLALHSGQQVRGSAVPPIKAATAFISCRSNMFMVPVLQQLG